MKLDILKYPDTRLEQVSTEVTNFDEHLHTLLNNLYDTLKAVAISAIQVNAPVRVVVIKFEDRHIEAINPKIMAGSGTQFLVEGCLSIPGVIAPVDRTARITITYKDRHGIGHINTYSGFMASIWQHEIDHLDGKLYIDKLSKKKQKKIKAMYAKRGK